LVKILISAPISDAKLYCWDEFSKALQSLPHDILLIDTSPEREMLGKIAEAGFNYLWRTATKPMDAVVDARQLAVDYALEGYYDYLLMIDADAIINKEIIEKLLRSNQHITSGLMFGLDKDNFPCPIPEIEEGIKIPESWIGTGLRKVRKIGFGCVLISHGVLCDIKIRCERKKGKLTRGEDYCFSDDALRAGYSLWVDTDIQVPHRVRGQWNWDEA
jgi:hypothetical protein